MSFVDGLISLGIILAFAWLIVSRIASKRPKFREWLHGLKKQPEVLVQDKPIEFSQQVWPDKASMI